ncbi:flagellar basal-body rod protein FlgG [Bacillus sp. V-88]|uniref:flagellar hook-basal body protein n=1 Tax=Rossellomorea vietnamensis TaxID=218284 RepID=UPI00054DA0FB|nr:flagellar hook-basal body protein [Rossellomorea vietnamensis]OXS56454.1 flagellar biosynthesis protein FlgC [Bacillus sp. DSM 27956]PRX72868.1 flagellar basal-body rod protein FlgG [Bacillus sp. V-88]SLK24219.1 flagellar basal-body rod protein FlgG [Bacillus sp. V-88]
MFRGFYTVASGMLSQQRKTEMLTNNMSNANTPGYKADQASMRAFPEMLMDRMDATSIPTEKKLSLSFNQRVGTLNTGVYMQETIPSFVQGDLQETGRGLDVALLDGSMPVDEETGISGSVFLTVEGPDGSPRYTRNGNLTVNGNGFLTTNSGFYMLDEKGGRIQLESDQFTVGENGQIVVDGNAVATLGVGYSDNPNLLVKQGDGLLATEGNVVLADAHDEANVSFATKQGFLERSNVDASRTMTDMMSAYRAFEANQKVLQAYDRSMEKAANEIGRVNG